MMNGRVVIGCQPGSQNLYLGVGDGWEVVRFSQLTDIQPKVLQLSGCAPGLLTGSQAQVDYFQ
jgi:hypothetical protein